MREEKIEEVMELSNLQTGVGATIFTNYSKNAPKNLHEEILQTLKEIKNFRYEFKVQSSSEELQKNIDKALEQVK